MGRREPEGKPICGRRRTYSKVTSDVRQKCDIMRRREHILSRSRILNIISSYDTMKKTEKTLAKTEKQLF